MSKGTEGSSWAITGVLDVVTLCGLVDFGMKLLLCARMAVLTGITGFTTDGVAPLITRLDIGARRGPSKRKLQRLIKIFIWASGARPKAERSAVNLLLDRVQFVLGRKVLWIVIEILNHFVQRFKLLTYVFWKSLSALLKSLKISAQSGPLLFNEFWEISIEHLMIFGIRNWVT